MENISQKFTGEHSGDGGSHHETLGRGRRAMSDAYAKAAQMANESYMQAKKFSYENPGKAMLIAMGIGVGLGIGMAALRVGTHPSRLEKMGKPLFDAFCDIGRSYFG